ncbi:MAG: hypothetical protein MUF16_03520 [Burkholderiaceae bacterium]|nr:hypothetical protein [Burkholderiaceae bacterium]
MRALPRRSSHGLRVLLLCGGALQAAAAWAGDSLSTEFWPEINAYLGLGERSRMMFSAAGTRAMEGSVDNRILAVQDAQFTLNVDYTLAPILRRDVPQAEWSKNRLLWARLGYEYGTSVSSGADSYRSDTGIVELNARYPMEGTLWLTSRLRADFRDINGEASQRYRVRAGAEWDVLAFEHPFAPYASVEVLYDTRYDKWSRLTLKAGVETPIGGNWRVEPYLALQLNKPDDELNRVLGLGLSFKVYFD